MHALGSVSKRIGTPGLILMYHRVGNSAIDPWNLSVSEDNFRQQIECLRTFATPVALRELPNATRGSSEIPALAVTFDDGYIDNLTVAAPILVKNSVPATVFVVSGYMGERREFWWDELARLLLEPIALPAVPHDLANDLNLASNRGTLLYAEAQRQSDRQWRASRQGATSPRLDLFLSIHRHLLRAGEAERNVALKRIAEWAGDGGGARLGFTCCAHEDLRALDAIEGIDIGAHTVTHPLLSTLPPSQQQQEIAQSHSELSLVLGRAVDSFSYPYGDVTDPAKACVSDLSLACACSTRSATVTGDADRYALPRVKVGDWDASTFAKKLSVWLSSR